MENAINIEQVLMDLYKSEIDFHMGFLFDGWFDYAFYNTPYPLGVAIPWKLIQHTWSSNLQEVFKYVTEDAIKLFPNSTFAEKYVQH